MKDKLCVGVCSFFCFKLSITSGFIRVLFFASLFFVVDVSAGFSQTLYRYELIECPDAAEACHIGSVNSHGNAILYTSNPNQCYLYSHETRQIQQLGIEAANNKIRILDDGSVHGLGVYEVSPGVTSNRPFRFQNNSLAWLDVGTEFENFVVSSDGVVSSSGAIAVSGYAVVGYSAYYYVYVVSSDGAFKRYDKGDAGTIVGVTSDGSVVFGNGYIDSVSGNFKAFEIPASAGEEISYVYAHASSDNGFVGLTYMSVLNGQIGWRYGYYNIKSDVFERVNDDFKLAYTTFLAINNNKMAVGQMCEIGCIAVVVENDKFSTLNSKIKQDDLHLMVAWTVNDLGYVGGVTGGWSAFLAYPIKDSRGLSSIYGLLLDD